MRRRLHWIFGLALATQVAVAFAAPSATQLNNMRAHGLAWLYTHQQGDGSWATAAGVKIQPTALAMDALLGAGLTASYSYGTARSWLANAPANSNDSLSRQIIALKHGGANTQTLAQSLIAQHDPAALGWGAYKQYVSSFPDTDLALDAILTSGASYANIGYAIGFMLSAQNADGGWPNGQFEPGTAASHLLPTAHGVYTLSRLKQIGYGVDGNITKGVNYLLSKQKTDGGFAEDTSATVGNPYDAALVWLALNQAKLSGNAAATGAQTAIDNAQQFLVNTQGADGSWGGGDALSTALALQTLPATTLTDTDRDGIPDVVESLIGTNPNVADARALAEGNGLAISGTTVAKILANATLGQPFSYTLIGSGGTPPYNFAVNSGSLPDGLKLNTATGLISGTPTRAGPFNFAYGVKDAANAPITTVQAQIDVTSVSDGDAPTLPEWGVILLASLLLAAQYRHQRKARG